MELLQKYLKGETSHTENITLLDELLKATNNLLVKWGDVKWEIK